MDLGLLHPEFACVTLPGGQCLESAERAGFAFVVSLVCAQDLTHGGVSPQAPVCHVDQELRFTPTLPAPKPGHLIDW